MATASVNEALAQGLSRCVCVNLLGERLVYRKRRVKCLRKSWFCVDGEVKDENLVLNELMRVKLPP